MLERISSSGRALIHCIFHNDPNPSLRIWPDGGFRCLGCGKAGWIRNHPTIEGRYLFLKDYHPAFQNVAQQCFPWRGVNVVEMLDEAPVPTGRRDNVTLNSCLFPWEGDQPKFLNVPGSEAFYLPIFSTAEKLEAFLKRAGVQYSKIVKVMDETEFLDSLPLQIRVMLDPYYTPEGKIRWMEVQR